MAENSRILKISKLLILVLIFHLLVSGYVVFGLKHRYLSYFYYTSALLLITVAYLLYKYHKQMLTELNASLQDRENLFSVVMENTSDLIFEINPDTKLLINANTSAKKKLGLHKEDFSKVTITDIIDISAENIDAIADKDGISLKTFSKIQYKPNINMEIYEAGKSALENRMLIFAKDINEEQKLLDRNRMFTEIIDASVNEVHIFRKSDLKYVYANKATLINTGYTFEEFTKLTPADIVPAMTKADIADALELVENKSYVNYTPQVRKDGSSYTSETHLQYFSSSEGDFYVAIVLDIDEKERVESELEKANRELERINRELQNRVEEEVTLRLRNEQLLFEQKKFADMGHMMSAISHQWRQPLNALGLVLQHLVSDARSGDTAEFNMLEDEGMQLVRYLSEIIDEFSDFFKPDGESEQFRVSECVFQTIQLLQRQMDSKGIEVRLKCKCGVKEMELYEFSEMPECCDSKLTLKGTESRFKQVILNLLFNSFEALSKKSSHGKKFIHIDIVSDSNKVRISVTDNGGGISEKDKDKVFSPYFSTKMNLNGPGIGLYMAKTILTKYMDADISFYNTEDGACFFITILK